MKTGAQELLSTLKSTQEAGASRAALAIVSPCSSCQNQRDMPDDQYPACPRRYWERRKREAAETDPNAAPPEYLTRKGRADDAGYENPVSWEAGNIRLVWAAALDENRAILNQDGTLKNPDILNAGFDTNFIVCRHMPFIPGAREGDYYAGNQMKEKDTVLINQVKLPQYDTGNPYQALLLAGFATKITAAQKFCITPGKKSVNQQGT